MSFQSDLAKSASDFESIVWPQIKHLVGDGTMYPVEGVAQEGFKRDLDTLAGIDAFQQIGDGLRGIASRVSRTRCWRTFTLRWSRASGTRTEFSKRLEALTTDKGLLYPYLTVHAYLNPHVEGHLLGVGIVKTRDLIFFVRDGVEGVDYEVKPVCDGNNFVSVAWDRLAEKGAPIKIWSPAI